MALKTRPFHCLDQWRSFARTFARKFQSERTCLSFCFAVAVAVVFFLTKAGVHLKAVFKPLKIGLILSDVSRSHFKQYKNTMLITEISVLGRFENFLVNFTYIWEEIAFSKE